MPTCVEVRTRKRHSFYWSWFGGTCALVIACAVDDPSGYRFETESNLGDGGSIGDPLPPDRDLAGSAGASGERAEGGGSGSSSEGSGGSLGQGGAGPNGVAGTAHGGDADCGNGEIEAGEACDDENARIGDGCALCEVEIGWRCAAEPSTCEDIDECAEQTDDCDENATCENASPSYSCTCDTGYEGDGTACAELPSCGIGDTRSCLDGCARGTCAGGTQTCSERGEWGACSIMPSENDSCEPGNDDDQKGPRYKAALNGSWDENYGMNATASGPDIPLVVNEPTLCRPTITQMSATVRSVLRSR